MTTTSATIVNFAEYKLRDKRPTFLRWYPMGAASNVVFLADIRSNSPLQK